MLTDLTDADAVALCRLAERSYKESFAAEEAYCTAAGAEGASSTAECERWKQECLDRGFYADDVGEDWECEDETAAELVDPEDAACTATVAELEACYRARGREISRYMESATCSDPSTLEEGDLPPECMSLRCPSLEDWD